MSDQPRKQMIGSAIAYVPPTEPDGISAAADLAFWHRSDQGLYTDSEGTTAASSGDTIGRWADLSGNSRHLKASASVREPTLTAGAGAGGYAGLVFNGTGNALLHDAYASPIVEPLHIFLLVEKVYQSNDYLFGDINDLAFSLIQQTNNTTLKMYTSAVGPASTNCPDSQALYLEVLFNDDSSTLIVDGNAAETGDIGTPGELDGLTVGASKDTTGYSECTFTEIFAYTSEITGDDLTDIRTYFNARYGVTVPT